MDEVGFNYEEWYQRQIKELGLKLIDVLHAANQISEGDSLLEPITEKIKTLNLPDEYCAGCGANMDFFTWGIQQGYCDTCIWELEAEDGVTFSIRKSMETE